MTTLLALTALWCALSVLTATAFCLVRAGARQGEALLAAVAAPTAPAASGSLPTGLVPTPRADADALVPQHA